MISEAIRTCYHCNSSAEERHMNALVVAGDVPQLWWCVDAESCRARAVTNKLFEQYTIVEEPTNEDWLERARRAAEETPLVPDEEARPRERRVTDGYCTCDSALVQPSRSCGIRSHREAANEALGNLVDEVDRKEATCPYCQNSIPIKDFRFLHHALNGDTTSMWPVGCYGSGEPYDLGAFE